MTTPLITKEFISDVKKSKIELTGREDPKLVISQLKSSLKLMDKLSYRVLQYILLHAKRVVDAGNGTK